MSVVLRGSVRVVRGPNENSKWAPTTGYRYDGLYRVVKVCVVGFAYISFLSSLMGLPIMSWDADMTYFTWTGILWSGQQRTSCLQIWVSSEFITWQVSFLRNPETTFQRLPGQPLLPVKPTWMWSVYREHWSLTQTPVVQSVIFISSWP